MVTEPIMKSVETYLRECTAAGFDISFGVIYGSFARGEANEWSDIDLLVVSPHFDIARMTHDKDLLWEIAALTDSRIEPVACGLWQWEHDDSSPIIEIARREGVRVELPEKVAAQTIARAE